MKEYVELTYRDLVSDFICTIGMFILLYFAFTTNDYSTNLILALRFMTGIGALMAFIKGCVTFSRFYGAETPKIVLITELPEKKNPIWFDIIGEDINTHEKVLIHTTDPAGYLSDDYLLSKKNLAVVFLAGKKYCRELAIGIYEMKKD